MLLSSATMTSEPHNWYPLHNAAAFSMRLLFQETQLRSVQIEAESSLQASREKEQQLQQLQAHIEALAQEQHELQGKVSARDQE